MHWPTVVEGAAPSRSMQYCVITYVAESRPPSESEVGLGCSGGNFASNSGAALGYADASQFVRGCDSALRVVWR